jgi:transcriptional regulator with PAS, ATPase and Fis domain
MKKKALSYYLDLMKSALDKQEWFKTKRYGETAIKKVPTLSYSPLEEWFLYERVGFAYSQLAEYSRSIDSFYKAFLIASKNHLEQSYFAFTSHMIGCELFFMRNINQALSQFQGVEKYYTKYGDKKFPMDKTIHINNLIYMGFCFLAKDRLEETGEIIEKKISPCLESISNDKVMANYYSFKGLYLLELKEYVKARQFLQETIKINERINSPISLLEEKMHLAIVDLLDGELESAITNLELLFKDAARLKINNMLCKIGFLLSKCYLLKNMPDKSASMERRIKPMLRKLDIIWFYEVSREFEQLYRQLQFIYRNNKSEFNVIPAIFSHTLNRHYEPLHYNNIIGKSVQMIEVFQLVEKIAPTDLPILIQGETGTGKELIARSIHQNSLRKNNHWLALNCGTVSETLLESELFGHSKGAYTDAHQERKGYIELASEGTLFLDEIGEMSSAMQQKLLRVMDEKLVWRIGAEKPIPVNTRFIFAGNQNIEELVKAKKFREDLYYRINTIVITLPSLRDRGDDIPLLVKHFLGKYHLKIKDESEKMIEISPEVLTLLQSYRWPGNVRELENEIKRICALYSNAKIITKEMLLESIQNDKSYSILSLNAVSLTDLTNNFQRNIIKETLIKSNGNLSQAARLLCYAPANLYRKIKQLNINTTKSITKK